MGAASAADLDPSRYASLYYVPGERARLKARRSEAHPIFCRVRDANGVIHTLWEIIREIISTPILSILIYPGQPRRGDYDDGRIETDRDASCGSHQVRNRV